MSKKDAAKEFNKVKEKKVKPEKVLKKDLKNKLLAVQNYLEEKYEFRYNTVAAKTEFSHKDKNEFQYIDERSFDNLIMEVKMEAGLEITDVNFRSLLGGPIATDYHPFEDYLSQLPVWDGKTDHFQDFLKQVQLKKEDLRPLFIKYFKKWFVAMVASLINDFVVNHTCFVLVGEQGRRKTTFLNNIVPEHLKLHYLYNGNYQLNNKDHEEMLGNKIVINLDELATLNRTDIELLKSRITQTQVNLRRAYGRAPIHLWRRASFCASINRGEFLTDQTGTRRFLVFEIHNIDLNEEFDIGLLYSQALVLYKDKFQFYFDQEEIRELEDYNLQFKDIPMEEELLMVNYKRPTKDDMGTDRVQYRTTSDIANELAQKYIKLNVNDSLKRKIGIAMKRLGFVRCSKRLDGYDSPVKVWEVNFVGSVHLDPARDDGGREESII